MIASIIGGVLQGVTGAIAGTSQTAMSVAEKAAIQARIDREQAIIAERERKAKATQTAVIVGAVSLTFVFVLAFLYFKKSKT